MQSCIFRDFYLDSIHLSNHPSSILDDKSLHHLFQQVITVVDDLYIYKIALYGIVVGVGAGLLALCLICGVIL